MLISLREHLNYINRRIDAKLDQRNQAKLLYQIFEESKYKELINQIDKDLSYLAETKRRILQKEARRSLL